MHMEKALALVVRTTDWSETSRIATLWTREFGKVRALAKGGRRLKSNFETALDLLNVCSMVFIRKSSGGLDLLTEAQVAERFPGLRTKMGALYAGYYVAELLSDWTQDYDPHPNLFDAALSALRDFGADGTNIPLRVAGFELAMIQELGYRPILDECAACTRPIASDETGMAFAAAVGGILCRACQHGHRDRLPISGAAVQMMRELGQTGGVGRVECPPIVRGELRRILGYYISSLMGKRPRLLPYLTSLP
jgi:DNA repair protein RecO (recombination protein O)